MDQALLELVVRYFPYVLIALGTLAIALILFSVQLLRYGPAIKRLNKLEVLSQLYHLGETQKEMTRSFGEATGASTAMRRAAEDVRKDLDNLREFITDIQEKLSETNADQITAARLEEGQSIPKRGVIWQNSFPSATPPKSPDQLFDNIKTEWAKFQDVFRSRLEEAEIPVQLNRIGKMTYMLADKRRRWPLPLETAELITALQSQYKRHISKQTISQVEHDNFVQLVKTAILEVQKKPSRAETATLRNGNGANNHEPQLPLM